MPWSSPLIYKVRYQPAEDGKDWVVERYDALGKELLKTDRYTKVAFKRPVMTMSGGELVTKATMEYKSMNGQEVSLEF